MRLTGEAVQYYTTKLNDAIHAICIEDLPYIISAMDGFRNALLNFVTDDCKEEFLEIVAFLNELKEENVHAIIRGENTTETAAEELYKAMREKECQKN